MGGDFFSCFISTPASRDSRIVFELMVNRNLFEVGGPISGTINKGSSGELIICDRLSPYAIPYIY